MTDAADICARIDAALEKTRFQQMEVRAIVLSDEDSEALDAAKSAEFGFKLHVLSYSEHHPVRLGKHSAEPFRHGVAVAVPKRLSARVAA